MSGRNIAAATCALFTLLFTLACGAPGDGGSAAGLASGNGESSRTTGAESPHASAPSDTQGLGDADAERFIPVGRAIFMRFHLDRIRGTPLAAPIEQAFQTSPVAHAFIGSSGLSPTQDFDQVLVGAPTVTWRGLGPAASHWVFVLRHRMTDTDAASRLAHIDAEMPLTFREHQGRLSALLPAEVLHNRHVIILTRPHEAVVIPEEEMPRAIAVAGDHDSRDPTRMRAMDADFVSGESELFAVESTRLPQLPGVPEHGRARLQVDLLPATPGTTEQRVRLMGTLECESEAAAIEAEPTLRAMAAIIGGGSETVTRDGPMLVGLVDITMTQAATLAQGMLSQLGHRSM